MKGKTDGTILRLVKETKVIRYWLLLACILSLGVIGSGMLAPKLLGEVVQKLYDFWNAKIAVDFGTQIIPQIAREILPTLLILLGLYGLYSLCSYLKMLLLNNVVSRYFTCALRIRISEKIKKLPISYLDATPIGQVISRMTDDVSVMGNTVHSVFDIFMTGFLQMLIISIAMFLTDWRLALVVVITLPASVGLATWLSSKSEAYFKDMQEESGKLYSIVEESYSNYPTSKAYNMEKRNYARHEEVNQLQKKATAKAEFMQSILQPVIAFFNSVSYIIISLLGGYLAVHEMVSVGSIVAIILYAKQFSSPLESIAQGLGNMQRTKASADRVFALLDEEEETDGTQQPSGKPVEGNVKFSHVYFSYKKDVPLIQDLNVEIKKGQNIAIVGPTGAGKTTIVNLLMRFYDLDKGAIYIDGEDISKLPRDVVRDKFAMVLQDTWLFQGTIRENVAYGKTDATLEEIQKACDDAYCDHFIRTLPEGYDTVVGKSTANISGGQRQLLTIARALLADKPLLILDEATSNVDTRTEVLIQKAMDRLMREKTCFVIAHRLSTIVDSDLILVVNDGKIVEKGNHQELLARKGFYYALYHSQYAIT